MIARIAICLIALANVAINLTGPLNPAHSAVSIAISFIVTAYFATSIILVARKETR